GMEVIVASNRLRCSSGFVDYGVTQHADIFGFDLDDIARLEIARWVKPRAGTGRRPRDDDVARHERGEGRDVVDEIAEAEDQSRGAIILPRFAVDPRRQADVGN